VTGLVRRIIALHALVITMATHAQAPPNDMFADRIELVGDYLQIVGDTTRATTETGEPAHCNSGNASLWWRWSAPDDGWVTISTEGSLIPPAFAVYSGANVSNLVFLMCSYARCPALDGESLPTVSTNEQMRVVRGQEYQFVFSSPRVQYDPFPAEDAPRGQFRFSLTFSTIQIVAPSNGARLFTQAPALVQIVLKDAPEMVAEIGLELDGVLLAGIAARLLDPHQYSYFLNPLPAEPHLIRARLVRTDGVTNWSEPVAFEVRPRNDDVNRAFNLTGTNPSGDDDVGFATSQEREVLHPNSAGGTVWYRWTAPENGIVRITTPSDRIAISVQRKNSSGRLEAVAFNAPMWSGAYSPVYNVLHFAGARKKEYFIQFSQTQEYPFFPVSFICDPPWWGHHLPFHFELKFKRGALVEPDIFEIPVDGLSNPGANAFIFAAPPGAYCWILASTDQTRWRVVGKIRASGGSELVFVPVDLNNNHDFYKLTVEHFGRWGR
jgi:hypothetical protein